MENERASAERWDIGCQTDAVRNEWLIPALVRILNHNAPATILDLGSATGFVPRTIDAQLSYHPKWTLIERDAARLEFAKQAISEKMDVKFLQGDFFDCNFSDQFECAIASFSLLEMDVPRTLARLGELVASNGRLHVAQPDAWVDVLVEAGHGKVDAAEFLNGSISISKIDRFTLGSYPFHAMRTERLISLAFEAGFLLSDILEGDVGGKRNYLLSFRKRGAFDE